MRLLMVSSSRFIVLKALHVYDTALVLKNQGHDLVDGTKYRSQSDLS